MPTAGHERGRAERSADESIVDELAAGLQSAAEEGIRRAATFNPLEAAKSRILRPSSNVAPSGFSV